MSKRSKKQAGEDTKGKDELIALKKLDTLSLKERLYQLREQLSQLEQKKKYITQQQKLKNQNYMAKSFQIEIKLKAQEDEENNLSNNYKLLQSSYEEFRVKGRQDWGSEKELSQSRKKQQLEEIAKKTQLLQGKVKLLQDFEIREKEYKATIDKLIETEAANKQSHQKDLSQIKAQHQAKRQQIQTNARKVIKQINESEVNKLTQKMSRQQEIRRENEVIQERITLCETERKVLEDQFNLLNESSNKNKNIASNQSLNGEASKTYERSLRLIKLENKLSMLKGFRQKQLARLDSALTATTKRFEGQANQIQQKIDKQQTSIRFKQKNIEAMRKCAKMVLDERNNLQAYLLEVFHEHPELDFHDAVNMNQILRYLFMKINSKKTPASYKDFFQKKSKGEISANGQNSTLENT